MIVSLYRNATLLQVVVTNGIDSEAPRAGNTGKRGFGIGSMILLGLTVDITF